MLLQDILTFEQWLHCFLGYSYSTNRTATHEHHISVMGVFMNLGEYALLFIGCRLSTITTVAVVKWDMSKNECFMKMSISFWMSEWRDALHVSFLFECLFKGSISDMPRVVFIEYNIKRQFSHSPAYYYCRATNHPKISSKSYNKSNMLLYKLTNKPFSDSGLKTVL